MANEQTTSRISQRWLVAILVVLVVVGLVTIGVSRTRVRGTVTVTGSATVQAAPDTVNFQLGVVTNAASASAALSASNARTTAVLSALESHGIAKHDIQTSGLNVYSTTNNQGAITGYSASNTLGVTSHHVNSIGEAIDAGVQAAGNSAQLSGITFSLSSDAKALIEARANAMKNALQQATDLGAAGNFHVGGVLHVTDNENQSSPSPIAYSSVNALATKASVPVQAGTTSVSVQVNVEYQIKN